MTIDQSPSLNADCRWALQERAVPLPPFLVSAQSPYRDQCGFCYVPQVTATGKIEVLLRHIK